MKELDALSMNRFFLDVKVEGKDSGVGKGMRRRPFQLARLLVVCQMEIVTPTYWSSWGNKRPKLRPYLNTWPI